jgi:hypothetical protein
MPVKSSRTNGPEKGAQHAPTPGLPQLQRQPPTLEDQRRIVLEKALAYLAALPSFDGVAPPVKKRA